MTWDLDNAFGYWLHLTFNRLRAESVRRFRAEGYEVTPEQWAVLVRLWQRDGRSQGELVEATFRDKTAITRLVDGLEEQGLVAREADPADRRRQHVALTEAGRALEGPLTAVVAAWVAEVTAGVPAEALAATVDVLRQVYANLERA